MKLHYFDANLYAPQLGFERVTRPPGSLGSFFRNDTAKRPSPGLLNLTEARPSDRQSGIW